MQLHSLPETVTKSKKRLGQGHGSGRVKTSGRGTKGQNARSKRPIQFEGGALPLTKRLPFLRGKDRNKPISPKFIIVNLDDINKLPAKTIVTLEVLVKHGLISKDAVTKGVKVLGGGSVDKEYTVKIPLSKSASDKIIKAGGSVNIITQ